MSFENLGLRAELLRAVSEEGYTTPTPIQAQAIPVVLSGRDLRAAAQTGTGKTAAFTLPLLQKLEGPKGKAPRVLVLTPTRELALQVEESVRTYGKHMPVRSICIFGGVGERPQQDGLRRGVDILVATPGRLIDLHGQGYVDFNSIEVLVLDEADRMLDMGFIHDIKRILKLLPTKRQNLLFSATYSDDIRGLAEGMLKDPAIVEVAARNTTADRVKQTVHLVDQPKKRHLLTHLIHSKGLEQVLIFTRTKHGANRLAEQLSNADIPSMAIHGNKSQSARVKALSDFKGGRIRALVATDIAARGLDIDMLPAVVNFELPQVAEDYVHRIGRTARAGAEGEAWSLVDRAEQGMLRDIEKLLKRSLEKEVVPGFEQDPNYVPEPIENGRGRGPRGPRPGGSGRAAGGSRPSGSRPSGNRPTGERSASGRSDAARPAGRGGSRHH
ncbi:MAG TPA: DEAD/DEAH box helicase [Holophagaceae bacterium]|nr:DEAD/DEAH box helicase [Holophagaceae bacterium]